ncbi:MAG: NAD-dependent epimerase/dehydratase family protein [Phycisphaerales bacterium]|nr:NAD-dependent epimerase/dehydratase family protein [Phycisphaerales bacterium]MCB9856671.1 NAD-dependent epimerase/dehydratase family protein [Phycisphaerales bacterium]MCB9862202.1 NAD-dependent epimerase/dehydratase family protein [Phycisphaerales bacterium]
MRAFVTGGSGFVGSHLIEQLIRRGDSVRALARPSSDHAFLKSLGADIFIGDIENAESLREACRDCDVCYHAAARVDMVGSEEDFRRTTIDGTRALMLAAAASGVKRFVHVSSCGAYHPKLYTTGAPINEDTPMSEPPKWFMYGRAKYLAERIVMEECPSSMEWVIVRLGYVFGPRNRTLREYVEPAMRDSMMSLVGSAKNPMAMVYVDDVAEAIAKAGIVANAAGMALIAAGTEHVTQRQYFDALADGFGMPRVRRKTPYWIAYFFGWLGEFLFKSGVRATSIRRASVALTGLPQRIDASKTQRLLNWTPKVTFDDGMARAFAWYRAEAERTSG